MGQRRSSGRLSEVHDKRELSAVGLDYRITGRWQMPKVYQVPQIELRVHPMDLTRDDRHTMQLDPNHIPSPTINDRFSSSFRLSTSMEPRWVAPPLYSFHCLIVLSQFLSAPRKRKAPACSCLSGQISRLSRTSTSIRYGNSAGKAN